LKNWGYFTCFWSHFLLPYLWRMATYTLSDFAALGLTPLNAGTLTGQLSSKEGAPITS
jgi:hypothetical protein